LCERLGLFSVRLHQSRELKADLKACACGRDQVAVESGSERLRGIVNKKLTQEEIITAVVNAQVG
jgi:radical SAM superfamily enzyme YgiQ (UPF0313 family)